MNVDVNRLIDAGRWTVFQKLLIAGTALTIILDGIGNQLLATVIPDLMKEWTLQRGDFSTARLAVGMALILICVVMGAAINAVQVSLYALAGPRHFVLFLGLGRGDGVGVDYAGLDPEACRAGVGGRRWGKWRLSPGKCRSCGRATLREQA